MDRFQGGHYSSYYFLDTALRAGLHIKAHCRPTLLPQHLNQQACYPLNLLPRKVVHLDLPSYLDRSKHSCFSNRAGALFASSAAGLHVSCHLT